MSFLFSKGQAARMRFYLIDNNSSRKALQTSPALAPPCPTYDCSDKNCGDNDVVVYVVFVLKDSFVTFDNVNSFRLLIQLVKLQKC